MECNRHLTFQCVIDYCTLQVSSSFSPGCSVAIAEKFIAYLKHCMTSRAYLMRCNGHITFQCVDDCWGTCSDAEKPGAILSCNVVITHGFRSHNCVAKS